jgi:arginase
VDQARHMAVGQGIVDVLALATPVHQPLGTQQAQPLGYGGELGAGGLGDLRDAGFAHGEQLEDLEPFGVAQTLEKTAGALEGLGSITRGPGAVAVRRRLTPLRGFHPRNTIRIVGYDPAMQGVAVARGTVALVGIPFDENSSLLRGPALAPKRVREALHSGSMNWCSESGLELGGNPRWRDMGDLPHSHGAAAIAEIEAGIAALLAQGARVLALGGDHSVTYPIVRAHARQYPRLNILHFDAHPDLYDDFEGNRFSHASPFARIMEEGAATRLVQVGIRTLNSHQREQAGRFGVEIVQMADWTPARRFSFDGPVYVTFDMDALDPSAAPGVSHHEPGGLSVRDVLGVLATLEAEIVGADIVEFNPLRDVSDMTAAVAAKLTKEFLAAMLR